MRSPRTEQRLRGLVARLAAEHPRDVAAVLEELSPDHRREVEELLADFTGQGAAPGRVEALSPWLQSLIAENQDVSRIKSRTRDVLRQAVATPVRTPSRPRTRLGANRLLDRLSLMKPGLRS